MEQVSFQIGITVPSREVNFGSKRMELGLTLDLLPHETPQEALKRCQKNVLQFVQSNGRVPLEQLDALVGEMSKPRK